MRDVTLRHRLVLEPEALSGVRKGPDSSLPRRPAHPASTTYLPRRRLRTASMADGHKSPGTAWAPLAMYGNDNQNSITPGCCPRFTAALQDLDHRGSLAASDRRVVTPVATFAAEDGGSGHPPRPRAFRRSPPTTPETVVMTAARIPATSRSPRGLVCLPCRAPCWRVGSTADRPQLRIDQPVVARFERLRDGRLIVMMATKPTRRHDGGALPQGRRYGASFHGRSFVANERASTSDTAILEPRRAGGVLRSCSLSGRLHLRAPPTSTQAIGSHVTRLPRPATASTRPGAVCRGAVSRRLLARGERDSFDGGVHLQNCSPKRAHAPDRRARGIGSSIRTNHFRSTSNCHRRRAAACNPGGRRRGHDRPPRSRIWPSAGCAVGGVTLVPPERHGCLTDDPAPGRMGDH